MTYGSETWALRKKEEQKLDISSGISSTERRRDDDNQNWRCSDAMREDKRNENVMAYAQYEKNGGRFSQVRVATSTGGQRTFGRMTMTWRRTITMTWRIL
jgi:hypothetical protein